MFLKPSEIRFSQDSIGNAFGNYTAHPCRLIGQTLDDILSGHCNVHSIPNISVMKRNDQWYTADNRRLWVFQEVEKRGKCDGINVFQTSYINSNKFTTYNEGRSVRVRGNPGGYLWRKIPTVKTSQTPNLTTKIVPSISTNNSSVYNTFASSVSKAKLDIKEKRITISPLVQDTGDTTAFYNAKSSMRPHTTKIYSSDDSTFRLQRDVCVDTVPKEDSKRTIAFTERENAIAIHFTSNYQLAPSSTTEKQDKTEGNENLNDYSESIELLQNDTDKYYHDKEYSSQREFDALRIGSSNKMPTKPGNCHESVSLTMNGGDSNNSDEFNRNYFLRRICIGIVVCSLTIAFITIVVFVMKSIL